MSTMLVFRASDKSKRPRKMSEAGTWGWFLQRVTAVGIGILLPLHLWQRHYGEYGKTVTFQNTAERLGNPLWLALGILFAGVIVYHTLYGLRAIIVDYVSNETARATIYWFTIAAIAAAFAVYVLVLLPFVLIGPA